VFSVSYELKFCTELVKNKFSNCFNNAIIILDNVRNINTNKSL